ncbi:MAG: Trk family potassium uptake protein [Nitrospirae bacterium]|nr:Trk family potassium uptake protein [Nitrospirota bacterium]
MINRVITSIRVKFRPEVIRSRMTPPRLLVLGFAAAILAGTVLLLLPFATPPGRPIAAVDAIFTATSAVCVTGLVVKDLSTDFTLFGQIVTLVLVQVGGLGYMATGTILTLLIGRRIGLRERLLLQESFNVPTAGGIVRFVRGVLLLTVATEAVGALVLFLSFLRTLDPGKAAYAAVFHAVSAFNNAGFSLFPTNLVAYRADWLVNLAIPALIIGGGIGFVVFSDLVRYARKEVNHPLLHTKIVLAATGVLIAGGTAVLWILERSNAQSIATLPFSDQFLVSFFHSVAARTAGFNTVDLMTFTPASLTVLMGLMFVGASPGGTGGGIKTTTFVAMMAALWATTRGEMDVTLFKRRIPTDVVAKSFFIGMLALGFVVFCAFVLLALESERILGVTFEAFSAFGTVGLSIGDGGILSLSAKFSPAGKIVICLLMFAGRLGPLTMSVAALRSHVQKRFRYPEGRVIIG